MKEHRFHRLALQHRASKTTLLQLKAFLLTNSFPKRRRYVNEMYLGLRGAPT